MQKKNIKKKKKTNFHFKKFAFETKFSSDIKVCKKAIFIHIIFDFFVLKSFYCRFNKS